MLAVGNHADIALVLAQDIGQQFLAAHVLEAVAAPAVGKVADRLEVIYRIHLREEAGGDDHLGDGVFLAVDTVKEVAETAALDDEFAVREPVFFTAADLCRNPVLREFRLQSTRPST